MLEVFDHSRKKIAILQHAYDISEELAINSVNTFEFALPETDGKNKYCQPFYYVRYNGGELYRIMSSGAAINERGDYHYKCEHVLALLIDTVLHDDHVVGNIGYYTNRVIQYVLDHQRQKDWVLGRCDFSRQFEYAWTDETLLSALFSVANRFTEPYIWTFNTKVYPFVINLQLLNENAKPATYVRIGKNALNITESKGHISICTRLYPKGTGEGVNQLTIKDVNNGVPYIESPPRITQKFGIIERVWVDRRYENPESLLEAARVMLDELQNPLEEYTVDFAALKEGEKLPQIGQIIDVVGYKKTYVTGLKINHDEVLKTQISIANKPKNIAGTIADMMDRQRVEMTYSQGATQFYQDHVYENATPDASLLLKLMIPSSMRIVNRVGIDVEIGPFRKPFTVTGGAGGQTIAQSNTTSSGASSTTTTAGGGQSTSGSSSISTSDSAGYVSTSTNSGGGDTSGSSSASTTASGGGSTVSSVMRLGGGYGIATVSQAAAHVHAVTIDGRRDSVEYGGAHDHVFPNFSMVGDVPPHTHNMQHVHQTYAHSHNFTIGAHYHGMAHTHNIYSHTHDMAHYHSIAHSHTIGDHTHTLNPGITYAGNPTSFKLLINGVLAQTVTSRTLQRDITSLLVDSQKKIPRDYYNRIEILPSDVAYVMLTVNVQGFIQSRGDMTV